MFRTLALAGAAFASLAVAMPSAANAFSISVKWCSGSPDIALKDVPKGTAAIEATMVDLMAPNYPHGGGKVAFSGAKTIPCGALSRYQGPSPPPNQIHDYQWTVEALDASGNVLATAQTVKKFPER